MATKVARMTPQTEDRIVRAVEAVIDRINDGDDPDDAITKIASEIQLPVGHVALLINAYNTGRTNRQREGHPGLIEKAADFPLADPAVILDRLFPKVVKSAAQVLREEGVSPDYGQPPSWLERIRDHGRLVKQAEASPRLIDPSEVAPPYPRDPTTALKRAYHAAIRRDREIEEARRVFSASQDDLVRCFRKLADWFNDPGHPTIADVRENVEVLWGRDGTAILDRVAASRPGLAKRAARYSRPQAVDRRAEPYRTIVDTIGQTRRVLQARDDFAQVAAEGRAKTADELAPFVVARRESPLGLAASAPLGEKWAGAYTTALGVQLSRDMLGHVGEQLRAPDKEQLVDKALRQISSPEHEQELRGIHTQAMLHNMLAADPIISSYAPHEVTEAFNEVSQLAPHAASQPAVMGPLLRKWLQQGNLDTFEGDQLVGTEQKLKQIHAPAPIRAPAPRKDGTPHG